MKAGGLQRARMLGAAAGAALLLSAGAAFAKAPAPKDAKPKPAITCLSKHKPRTEKIMTLDDSLRAQGIVLRKATRRLLTDDTKRILFERAQIENKTPHEMFTKRQLEGVRKAAVPMTPENFKRLTGDAQVILTGESHPENGQRESAAQNFGFYRSIGVRALVFEAIPVRLQPDLDEYAKTGQMSKTLRSSLAGILFSGFGINTPLSCAYVLRLAQKQGFRLVAGGVSDFADSAHYDQFSDSLMAQVVESAIPCPNGVIDSPAKVLHICGRAHIGGIARRLREQGISAIAIRLAVPKEGAWLCDWEERHFYSLKTGLINQPFPDGPDPDEAFYKLYSAALKQSAANGPILVPAPTYLADKYDLVQFSEPLPVRLNSDLLLVR